MPNSIKGGGDGDLRLQITKPARQAGLVREDNDGEPTDLAEVYVYTFDDLILVIDSRVSMGIRAGLISKASDYTDSMHTGVSASVSRAGHGYQVNLPGAKEAGFAVGDSAPVVAGDGLLLIHDGTQAEVAEDLKAIHDER